MVATDQLLGLTGLDQTVREADISKDGKGFILTFSDPSGAEQILRNKSLFAGGGSGGSAFHQGELEDKFGKGGSFQDFRSFNGGNTKVDNRSLQVVLHRDNNGKILGAYVDTDRFNTKQDLIGIFGHTFGEVIPYGIKRLFGKKC